MKNQDELLAQLAKIVTLGEKVLATEESDAKQKSFVNETKFHDFRISALSFLSRIFGEENTFYTGFKSEVTQPTASRTRRGLGILEGAQRELSGSWLETTTGAIARDILADMLRIAKLRCDSGDLRAAVAIAYAVLEKQLRNLCQAQGISLHNETQGKAVAKRALQLAGEAYKKKLFERPDNKNILTWLELSEKEGEKLESKEVITMINGINSFLAKTRY